MSEGLLHDVKVAEYPCFHMGVVLRCPMYAVCAGPVMKGTNGMVHCSGGHWEAVIPHLNIDRKASGSSLGTILVSFTGTVIAAGPRPTHLERKPQGSLRLHEGHACWTSLGCCF